MDRRQFLMTGAAAGAAIAMPLHAGQAQPAPPRPRTAKGFYVDGVGGLDGFDEPEPGRFVPGPRFLQALRERRLDVMCTTLGEVGNGPDRFKRAVQSIAEWDRMIASNSAVLAKIERAADIPRGRDEGKLGIIYGFQDTTALEGEAAQVATFAALGLRILQLTYNKRNLAGDGCLERANGGISDFGREVIAKVNESNLLLDLSHAGQRTQAEGIAAAKAPPAITHSGCRALADLPRNTRDAEMRALADKGGVFGVYLMPFLRTKGQPGREDLLRHLDHAVKVCGEDHVGIGTDGPLTGYVINDEARKQQREFFERRAKLGIAAPGEAADVFNMVEGYNSVDRYDLIGADLRRRGWSSARIEKVLGNNFVRLFGEVWKA
jgi:membrane dipeptidase